jgi:hypothetical protein
VQITYGVQVDAIILTLSTLRRAIDALALDDWLEPDPDALVTDVEPEPDEVVLPEPVALVPEPEAVPEPDDVPEPDILDMLLEVSRVPVISTLWPTCGLSLLSSASSL